MAHTYRIMSRLVMRRSRPLDWPLFSLPKLLDIRHLFCKRQQMGPGPAQPQTLDLKQQLLSALPWPACLSAALPTKICSHGLEEVFVGKAQVTPLGP